MLLASDDFVYFIFPKMSKSCVSGKMLPDTGMLFFYAAPRDTRAMMQLGDIAMESVAKSAANIQHAQAWYRKAAGGHPPQPNGIFQMARIHHEVRQ